MVRRQAVVGALFACAGVLFGAWSQALAVSASVPGQAGASVLTFAVGVVSSLLIPIGAVVLAATVLTVVTGRAPVRGSPTVLLWLGLGLVVGSLFLEAGAWWLPGAGADVVWAWWIPLEFAYVVRWVGSAVLGLWLTGLLTAGSASLISEEDTGAPRPSAPSS